jgi:hypothetical protein
MPCYNPIDGYRSKYVNESGKRSIVFNREQGFVDLPVKVPCGRCIGCRLEYSRQWAVRCVHEASLHEENSFVTLTYRPEEVPEDHSIHKEEVQKFIKRLRKELGEQKIRYFACGEYGEQRNRPHYHLIIFGYGFPDKRLWSKKNGNLLFRSELLEKVWTKGFSSIGEVTFESAAYVARYVMKKRKGKDEPERYTLVDKETGEVHYIEKEFCLMSRRPGLGKGWYEKYKSDTDKDFITIRGAKMKLPKYYDSQIEKESELEMKIRKGKRIREAIKRKEDNTMDRLRVKEKVKKAQLEYLKRDTEEM